MGRAGGSTLASRTFAPTVGLFGSLTLLAPLLVLLVAVWASVAQEQVQVFDKRDENGTFHDENVRTCQNVLKLL